MLSSPTPFQAALDHLRSRSLLPVGEDTGSAELNRIPAALRARATFSARTRHTEHLAAIQGITDRLLDSASRAPADRVSLPEARQLLRASLQRLGYSPDQVGAAPGTLRDLASTRRLNLIIQQNLRSARGYGQVAQGRTDGALLAFPAQELIRTQTRQEPRLDWPQRFREAGGTLRDGGRMVALKDDPLWTRLSVFGQPWPPFDYGSGMGLRDVSRREALRLGLIEPGTPPPAPQPEPLNAPDLDAAPAAQPTGTLLASILQTLGTAAQLRDGLLHILPS
jgi:hypothetical protein